MDSPDRPVRRTVRFRADGTLPSNNVASSSCPSLGTLDSDDDEEPDSITPNHTAYFCTRRKVNLSPSQCQDAASAPSKIPICLFPQGQSIDRDEIKKLRPKANFDTGATKLQKIPDNPTVFLLQCLSTAHREALQRSYEANAEAEDASEWTNLAIARESSPLRGLLLPPPPFTIAHDYLHNNTVFSPFTPIKRELSEFSPFQEDTTRFSN